MRLLPRRWRGARGFPVVLPAFWQSAGAGTRGRRVLTEPLPALARSARVGLVNVFPDDDGLVRDAVHRDGFGARDYQSASAILAGRNDLQNVTAYPIDFRIAPQSFTYVSYSDVLAGRVPDQAFTGRTVLVGATALELGDQVPVPVYRTIPGVTPPGPAVRESAPGPAARAAGAGDAGANGSRNATLGHPPTARLAHSARVRRRRGGGRDVRYRCICTPPTTCS